MLATFSMSTTVDGEYVVLQKVDCLDFLPHVGLEFEICGYVFYVDKVRYCFDKKMLFVQFKHLNGPNDGNASVVHNLKANGWK